MKSIQLSDTENPRGLVSLVERLPSSFKEPQDYQIRFSDGYLYSCVFPVIAAWSKRIPEESSVKLDLAKCQESARRLVENIGLVDVVENALESPRMVYRASSNVPLQPIVVGHSTDEVLDRVHRIVDEWATADDTSAFRVMLSELAENILVHSEADTPGYVHARVHRSSYGSKCEITFADSGIGILNSYLGGTNENVKRRIEAGASALEIALDGLNTSKPREAGPGGRSHFGYGLFTVKRLIELNRSRMTIVSGDEYVTLDRYQQSAMRLKNPWEGTIVSLIVDLGNPLPLDQVYEEEHHRLVPPAPKEDLPKEPSPERVVEARSTSHSAAVTEQEETRRFVVSEISAQLLSREVGLRVRAELATLLAVGTAVEVDLDGVEDITPSVADECFGKLAVRLGETAFRRRVKLRGGSAIMHRLIEFVIATRVDAEDKAAGRQSS